MHRHQRFQFQYSLDLQEQACCLHDASYQLQFTKQRVSLCDFIADCIQLVVLCLDMCLGKGNKALGQCEQQSLLVHAGSLIISSVLCKTRL